MTSSSFLLSPPPAGASSLVPVCRIDEIPLGMGRTVTVQDRPIAVFRTRGGKVFALDNECPHRGGVLADGIIAGDRVVCPLHALRFSLHDGACETPGVCSPATYPVDVRDGWIFIEVPVTV